MINKCMGCMMPPPPMLPVPYSHPCLKVEEVLVKFPCLCLIGLNLCLIYQNVIINNMKKCNSVVSPLHNIFTINLLHYCLVLCSAINL